MSSVTELSKSLDVVTEKVAEAVHVFTIENEAEWEKDQKTEIDRETEADLEAEPEADS